MLMLKRVQLFFEKLNIPISCVNLTLKSFDYTKPRSDPTSLFHAVVSHNFCPVILQPSDANTPTFHAMAIDHFDPSNREYVCKDTYPTNGGKKEIPEYQGHTLSNGRLAIEDAYYIDFSVDYQSYCISLLY